MKTDIEQLIKQKLPDLIQQDPEIRAWVIGLTRQHYADRIETESRFDRIMDELRRDREEQARKWDEENKKWAEQNRKWDEQKNNWDEQNRKWEESSRQFQAMHEEIMKIAQKHDRSIGALGSRWGIQTEKAFRNALAAILVQSFDVKVLNVNEYDDTGEVFGRPEQVELDIIIKNGVLIICEIKSSIDKASMYIFERKARFYEKRHQRKANRLLVISPMIDQRAQTIAQELGIETYGDSEDVESL